MFVLNTVIYTCSYCQGDIDAAEFEFVKKKAIKDMREHPEHPDRKAKGASSPTRADPAVDTPPGSPERLAKRRERELKVDALPTTSASLVSILSDPSTLVLPYYLQRRRTQEIESLGLSRGNYSYPPFSARDD